ncbi:hypothetical protein G7Z17_g1230 [Cylindrodendrum hubeiense]|uniref:Uncharacterized protein n=1 Tax=Cylindrodendrum hubeiense TaxID=595255 RepID=A0A9P5HL84_9HYPO|nr:hypothetical protein G7Z17_g1230 [Cylindrodendrum hubeiense]
MITFCDKFFDLASNKSPVRNADSVVEGTDIDDFAHKSMARIMIHEFAHYYGTEVTADRQLIILPDKQAVDKNECKLWLNELNKYIRVPATVKGVVYGFQFVSNLVRDQTGNEQVGKWREDRESEDWIPGELGEIGPAAGTMTAEAYAYFAIMSQVPFLSPFESEY